MIDKHHLCYHFECSTCYEINIYHLFSFFQKYKADIFRLETLLREKNKENKRLKDNFETLKQANDALKKEVSCTCKLFLKKGSANEHFEYQAFSYMIKLESKNTCIYMF